MEATIKISSEKEKNIFLIFLLLANDDVKEGEWTSCPVYCGIGMEYCRTQRRRCNNIHAIGKKGNGCIVNRNKTAICGTLCPRE